jgi:general stress protein 26
MNDQEIRARARQIIDKSVNAIFTTMDEHGFPHPRTMWTAGMDDDFTAYFVTSRSLLKIRQIEADPRVCLFWTQVEGDNIGWSYAFIKGKAEITDEQALRDRFWNDTMNQYFPHGRQDPDYVVIKVKPIEMTMMDSHKYPLERVTF